MNLSGAKALAFCRKPSSDARVFLIFGADEGVVSDAADTLARQFVQSTDDIVRLQEDDIKKDPARLSEELSARALLGGSQLLRLHLTNESFAAKLKTVLDDLEAGAFHCENPLIIEAGDLSKKSKTRQACESSPVVQTLHMFADSEADVMEIVKSHLSENEIEIDQEALEAFATELPGDRRLARSEIDKLSLYAIGLGRAVNVQDIKAVSATEQPKGADDAADAALGGHAAKAVVAIDRFLDAGGSPVGGLRTVHFRLMRALDAQAGAKFLRPPVFGPEKTAFNAMLRDWNAPRITRALTMVYAAEKVCKQGGAPAEAALRTVIDRISQRRL